MRKSVQVSCGAIWDTPYLRLTHVTVFLFVLVGTPLAATAQETDTTRALRDRIDRLESTLANVQAQLAALQGTSRADAGAAPASSGAQIDRQQSPPSSVPGSMATASSSGVNPEAVANQEVGTTQPTRGEQGRRRFFERKPGKDLTFYTHGGEITAYGRFDVSVDGATKGISDLRTADGSGPIGNGGWLADVSTNLSYIGVKGTQATGIRKMNFIYQLETQVDISTSSGISESNSQQSNTVKGGLTSRNTFIGLGSKPRGAFLFGKTDAPYKQATARMNPFSGMVGDYSVIMGNSGGDNRVEFGTRLEHSLWYTSPKFHGIELNALFSPGQNRSTISDNLPSGSSDCSGSNIPGSGGSIPFACNDGSFSNAYSISLAYTKEPAYIVLAYERHKKVNRQSDITGIDPNAPTQFVNADVADEDAAKVGVQYTIAKVTTVSAIYESLHRYVPGFLEFQNERQRSGSWLAVTQVLSKKDSFSAGWARAYRTPGDPGQHNTALAAAPAPFAPGDTVGGRGVDNSSNMVTVAYKHQIGTGLTLYGAWAGTFNGPYAHFDLGAGGRGVTTDCHDASDATGDQTSSPHCWAGGHLKAVSVGMEKRF